MKYFKKINLQNSITDSAGKAIAFDSTNDGNGVIVLDETADAALIVDLDKFADERRCGVVRVSKEIYDALLKKKALMQSRRPSDPRQSIRLAKQPDPFNKSQKAAAVAAGGEQRLASAPLDLASSTRVDLQQFRTRTKKMLQTKPQSQ